MKQIVFRVGLIITIATLVWLGLSEYFENGYNRSEHVIRALIIFFLIVPIILSFWRFLDKRSLKELHIFPTKSNLIDLTLGAICWIIPAAIGFISILALGLVEFSTVAQPVEIFGTFLLLIPLVFIYEAFPEELLFRGYIQTNLARIIRPSFAIIIQALLFTLWGYLNGGDNSIDRTLLFFSFAFVVGTLRNITGNIWIAVGFHLAFQVVAQFLGDVGGVFEVKGLNYLMIIAFVILPFFTAVPILKRIRH